MLKNTSDTQPVEKELIVLNPGESIDDHLPQESVTTTTTSAATSSLPASGVSTNNNNSSINLQLEQKVKEALAKKQQEEDELLFQLQKKADEEKQLQTLPQSGNSSSSSSSSSSHQQFQDDSASKTMNASRKQQQPIPDNASDTSSTGIIQKVTPSVNKWVKRFSYLFAGLIALGILVAAASAGGAFAAVFGSAVMNTGVISVTQMALMGAVGGAVISPLALFNARRYHGGRDKHSPQTWGKVLYSVLWWTVAGSLATAVIGAAILGMTSGAQLGFAAASGAIGQTLGLFALTAVVYLGSKLLYRSKQTSAPMSVNVYGELPLDVAPAKSTLALKGGTAVEEKVSLAPSTLLRPSMDTSSKDKSVVKSNNVQRMQNDVRAV